MRLAVAILLLAACGTEPTRSASPDAATAMTATDAGSDAPLSICDQAAQHSDLAWIQSNVFNASCARSNCHITGNEAGGLILEAGKSRDYLVNMPSSVDHGMMRVLPGDPSQSNLLVAAVERMLHRPEARLEDAELVTERLGRRLREPDARRRGLREHGGRDLVVVHRRRLAAEQRVGERVALADRDRR